MLRYVLTICVLTICTSSAIVGLVINGRLHVEVKHL
jgi:hypothetical protein